jgi:hypothetical protein
MSGYISSNANRFYVALESAYGSVAAVTAAHRIPALKLTVQQQMGLADRKDKTGSRTYGGVPTGGRKQTTFELRTYLTSWDKSTTSPVYGPLVQAALGGAPLSTSGGTVTSSLAQGQLAFAANHGLVAGQAVASASEIRFVTNVVDPLTIQLNAPFTVTPTGALGGTVTYTPATNLPSVSVFDYWSPTTAVQRLLCGAGVDQMTVLVNGDYHEVHFKGIAQDVLDTSSFSAGGGSLPSFPVEPALSAFDFSVVPGNLGQAWLGTSPNQFFTVTSASLVVKNALDTRSKEFGSSVPRAISPGQRSVTAAVDLYSQDDMATTALYQAARQRSPITAMFQLGESAGQMMALYMKSVVPEVPEFDDGEQRLQWKFRPSRARGTADDEVVVAFA